MMKIGLLGGAFDPVHLGHLAVAKAVLRELQLDKVWFLPSGCHRDKSAVAGFERRIDWLERAVADEQKFEVKNWDKGDGRVCYTADLLERLPRGDCEYFFIIGEDNAKGLAGWHRFEWLMENVRFVVVSRQDAGDWQKLDYAHKLQYVQMEPVDVCSAKIRGCPERYGKFLPAGIRKEVATFYGKKVG